MDNFAITAADAVSRRYKSNDPEAIIAQRTIKIKDIRFCEELLGFYTVLLNCEYIGINPNCSKQQRRSALAHELGHAIFDRKHAASGQAFQDTYFYSLSNAKAERRANTFAAELLLSDDDVLKPIGFYKFSEGFHEELLEMLQLNMEVTAYDKRASLCKGILRL